MGFYQDRILPHLINLAMRQRNLTAYRQRLIPAAGGRVLEVGIGSGFNLPYYTADVERVIGLDPSPKLLEMTRGARVAFEFRSTWSRAAPSPFRWTAAVSIPSSPLGRCAASRAYSGRSAKCGAS